MSQTKAQLIDPVDGSIVNADINASAAIAGTKVSPNFGSQNIVTTGSITGNDLEIDSGTLSVDASNNRVGINTTSPSHRLDISQDGVAFPSAAGSTIVRIRNSAGSSTLSIDANAGNVSAVQFGDTDAASQGTLSYNHSSNHMQFNTGAAERMRIDSSGRLLLGTTASRSVAGGQSRVQIENTSTEGLSVVRTSNDNGTSLIAIGKTRNGAIVQDDDVVGTLGFYGHDGNDIDRPTAEIRSAVDGTPGANDMPGRLEFKTTSDGSSTTTERMRIDSSGTIFSFSTNSTTPNIKWRSNDVNWHGSLNQSVGGGSISTILSTGGDWSVDGTTYSATKTLANFETRAIILHPQFNNSGGKVAFLQKAAGSSTTDGAVTEILNIDNGGIKPGSDNAVDLGSASFRWRNLYTTDLKLSNEGSQNDVDSTWGNYTIQEGHEDLFLLNHRTGKKFKFNLTEVA
jgi:hypothetical protein